MTVPSSPRPGPQSRNPGDSAVLLTQHKFDCISEPEKATDASLSLGAAPVAFRGIGLHGCETEWILVRERQSSSSDFTGAKEGTQQTPNPSQSRSNSYVFPDIFRALN